MKNTSFATILFFSLIINLNAQVSFVKERTYLSLSDWVFKKGVIYNAQANDFNSSDWEAVKVPHTYSMDAIDEVGYYRGDAWYRSSLKFPESIKNERIFIRFEGVGHEAEVFVNNKKIGKHIGGYSAFCFEITDAVSFDTKNLIAVRVSNRPDLKRIPVDDFLFNHYGGIYRPVQIFSTPSVNISPLHYASSGVYIETKKMSQHKAEIEIRTHLSSKNAVSPVEVKYVIKDGMGQLIEEKTRLVDITNKETTLKEHFIIVNPNLWDGLSNPHLYTLEISVLNDEKLDQRTQTFGLKTFEVNPENGTYLNGKPYRVYGVALDEEWKQYGPALLDEHIQTDMKMIKDLGASAARFSHYQHSDLKYQMADEMGLMVWTEIPFVHDYSGRESANAKEQLKELILQNYNHPSIFVWGLWNEVRALYSSDEPCVILTKELNDLAHQLDPTRMTTSASDRGLQSNMGNISDLQAWNKYYGWYYGEYKDMGTWLDESRLTHPEIALGISEYGVGGNIFQQDISKMEKPNGNYFPEPVQTEYHEVTWQIFKERPFVWCTFIWNMFDFSVAGWNRGGIPNLNHKGLVTYDRAVKKDAFYFYQANWSNNPMVHIVGRRDSLKTQAMQTIKVYTNEPKVTLFVNGKKIGTKNLSKNQHIINFTGIKLQKGTNSIVVTTSKSNLKDEISLSLKN